MLIHLNTVKKLNKDGCYFRHTVEIDCSYIPLYHTNPQTKKNYIRLNTSMSLIRAYRYTI